MTNVDMSIGRRLALSFGMIFLLLLAVLAIYLLGDYQQVQATNRLADVVMPKADAANGLEIAYLYQSAGARSYILTGEERWLADYRRGLELASEAVSRLDRLPKTPEGTDLFNEMRSLATRFTQLADRAIALRRQGATEEARQLLASEMYPTRDQLLSRANAFVDLQYRLRDEAKADLARVEAESARNSIAVALLALIIGAILAYAAASSVRKPVKALVTASDRVAAGDYTSALDLSGKVASAGSEIPKELKHLAARMKASAQDLLTREAQLQVRNEELRARAEELAELTRALAESEERFRTVFKQAAMGIARVGLDGRFLEVNERFSQMTGYEQEELLGLTYLDVTQSDGSQARPVQGERMLRGEIESYSSEKRTLRKDGSTGWVNVTSSTVREASGNPKYVIAVAEDITERKRSEEALRESEERLRLVTSHSPDNTWIQDLDLRYTWMVNPLRPFSLEQMLGKTDFDLGSRAEAEGLTAIKRRVLETGIGAKHEVPLVIRGEERFFEAVYEPYRGEGGQIAGLFGYVREITERKRAEAERERLLDQIEADRQQAVAALDSMHEALGIWDLDGNPLVVNPAGLNYLRAQTVEEVPQMRRDTQYAFELCYPDGSSMPYEEWPVVRALRGESIKDVEVMISSHKTGSEDIYSFSGRPIMDQDGKVTRAVVTWRDITGQKRAEEEREQLIKEIQLRADRQDEFVSIISHDLRTPITAIQGNAQMIQKYSGRPEAVERSAEAVYTSAKRMNRMIQDLVESAKLESGQVRLEKVLVDLSSFVSDLKHRLTPVMDTNRISVQAIEDLPSVLADPDRMERVLTNLISNALKYSDDEVVVSLNGTESIVRVSVSDHGPGISQEDQSRLFDRYYRAERTSKAEGLGLGLYITRMLVEAHGGRIWVESEVGKGSTFTIELLAVDTSKAAVTLHAEDTTSLRLLGD